MKLMKKGEIIYDLEQLVIVKDEQIKSLVEVLEILAKYIEAEMEYHGKNEALEKIYQSTMSVINSVKGHDKAEANNNNELYRKGEL